MSYVWIAPEILTLAAGNLADIGSAVTVANIAATSAMTEVLAAGEDEVSARVAELFGLHGREYLAASAHAEGFQQRFVQSLAVGSNSYSWAEGVNAER